MEGKGHQAAGDARPEATVLELWAAGELDEEPGTGGAAVIAGAMTCVLVALAGFFVVVGSGI